MVRRQRVLLDTNVLISAVISKEGVAARLVVMAAEGRCELVVSPKLLGELEEVLGRSKFRRYLSVEEARRYVELMREASELVEDPPESIEHLTPDPDDDYLVALARAADIDVIRSGDDHLSDLAPADYAVKSPREFLGEMEAEKEVEAAADAADTEAKRGAEGSPDNDDDEIGKRCEPWSPLQRPPGVTPEMVQRMKEASEGGHEHEFRGGPTPKRDDRGIGD